MANLAASLPPPTPLSRGLTVHFQWGEQKFEMVATAASVRTAVWEQTGEEVTWLHCKAIQVQALRPDTEVAVTGYLIPADYVTHLEPGATFRVTRSRRGDLGVFPPTQPPPPNPVPLAELKRVIGSLVDESVN